MGSKWHGIIHSWPTGLFGCMEDRNSCLLGWLCPSLMFGQNVFKFTGGEISFTRAFITHGLLGGFCCGLAGIVVGPPAFWPSCVPCLGAYYRKRLRDKERLLGSPKEDFSAHCLCHQLAVCQEYRQLRDLHSDIVPGPTHPTIDRGPEETLKYLEAQRMQREIEIEIVPGGAKDDDKVKQRGTWNFWL